MTKHEGTPIDDVPVNEAATPRQRRSNNALGAASVRHSLGNNQYRPPLVTGEGCIVSPDFAIKPGCVVSKFSTIAEGCVSGSNIGQRVSLESGVAIGRGCTIGIPSARKFNDELLIDPEKKETIIIGQNVVVEDGVAIYNGVIIGDSARLLTKARVGRQVKPECLTVIGSGVIVGEGAVIEAGAVIGRGYEIHPGALIPSNVRLKDRPRKEAPIFIGQKFLQENGFLNTKRRSQQ